MPFRFAILLLLSFGSLLTAQAGVVTVSKALLGVAPDVVSGANNGGLDNDVNTDWANGSNELLFRFTVDDTAGTGSTFEALLALSSPDTGASGSSVRSNVAGRIVMGSQVGVLDATLQSFSVTSGPTNVTLAFDGFSLINADQWTLATDTLTVGGSSFTGNVDTMPLTLTTPGASLDASTGGNQWRIGNFDAQFTASVTAVPEPSSLALLAFGGLGMVARRRRRPRAESK